MTVLDAIPRAIHKGEDELPFVDIGDGSLLQLLHADIEQGLWVVRTKFNPGYRVQTHKHTGPVYAFTISGKWKYEEYPDEMIAGSYLFEPANSIHTLTVPEDNAEVTDVWFAIWGANLNLDGDGNVESVLDAKLVRDGYLMLCEAQGLPRPDFVHRDPRD